MAKTEKTLIAFKPAMKDDLDKIALVESRTRSELIREACRRYIDDYARNGRIDLDKITLPDYEVGSVGQQYRPADAMDFVRGKLTAAEIKASQAEIAEQLEAVQAWSAPSLRAPTLIS